jgi:hypothetical protein
MKKIESFKGANEFLSNFYNAPVKYEGILYLNNEKMEDFSRFVHSLGFRFDPHKGKPASQFHQLMTKIKGSEEEASAAKPPGTIQVLTVA